MRATRWANCLAPSITALLAGLVLWGIGGVATAEGIVQLELIIQPGGSPAMPQRWLPVLANAGFSQPSIRSAQSGDRLEITTSGTADSPVYQVRGLLTIAGTVKLPPGTEFSLRDTRSLAEWVRRLKAQGPETAAGGDAPFGLTPSQIEEVKKDLGRLVSVSTSGADPAATLTTIAQGLGFPLVIDDSARQALTASGNVRDQLQGFSSGTAIAALVRPAGLVLRPRFNKDRIEYLVTDGRAAGDNWPIGWKSDQNPGRLVPGLFEKDQTQEVEVSLSAALKELEGRVKAPFLYDYNALALTGVDLHQTKVKMKAAKTYYGRVLTRVLAKAKLDYDVRIDDAGRAFLWISSVKR